MYTIFEPFCCEGAKINKYLISVLYSLFSLSLWPVTLGRFLAKENNLFGFGLIVKLIS